MIFQVDWRLRRSQSWIRHCRRLAGKQVAPNAVGRPMRLPVPTTLSPMEAVSVDTIPVGREWQYEPKWDGFRCLTFWNGKTAELRSKSGQPLARYFPEIVESIRQLQMPPCVLDGELVIRVDNALSFDALLQRIHPAESRVRRLAGETPAWLAVFDLLAEGSTKLLNRPLADRRARLDAFAKTWFAAERAVRLSPATRSVAIAKRWFGAVGTALDGIIAKRRDAPYGAGTRGAMVKVKPTRTADCVVGGFRYAEKARVVGSLLLGLYDNAGLLHHVGFCSGIKTAERPALTQKLEALVGGRGFTGRAPGGPSRWSTKRSMEWRALEPKLVVEVSFDHVSGGRFRHGTALLRWRPDKSPRQCTMAQLAQKRSRALALLQSSRRRGRAAALLKT